MLRALAKWLAKNQYYFDTNFLQRMKNVFLTMALIGVNLAAFSQSFTMSNLPIVVLNTNGKQIVNEPKVMVDMKIIYNGVGKMNLLTDTKYDYQGKIGIEFRGSTSQDLFPKKPYGFETWDNAGKSINVSVLGLPAESDWIFYPSYNDKTLMNNVFVMKMARDMGGMYSSRTQYVEMVLDNQYMGVYVLMEKIKRDANRVNVTKIEPKDVAGNALTGGYIFKIDKTTGSDKEGWASKIAPSAGNGKINYLYDTPKAADLALEQRNYLRAYVDSAEAALMAPNFQDKTNGFRRFYDAESFAKMFLINEVTRNVDGYRISTFFSKDRTSKGGKIKAGPPWDYDITLGNADYCQGFSTTGWAYQFGMVCPDDFWQVPVLWQRMLSDTAYVTSLRREYLRLRAGAWNTTKLHANIDSIATLLSDAQTRNFVKWPVLGQKIWPNPSPVPATYPAQIMAMKTWIAARLNWLDQNMPGAILSTETPVGESAVLVEASPNPVSNTLRVRIQSPARADAFVEVVSSQGQIMNTQFVELSQGENTVEITANHWSIGVYALRIHSTLGVVTRKIIKI